MAQPAITTNLLNSWYWVALMVYVPWRLRWLSSNSDDYVPEVNCKVDIPWVPTGFLNPWLAVCSPCLHWLFQLRTLLQCWSRCLYASTNRDETNSTETSIWPISTRSPFRRSPNKCYHFHLERLMKSGSCYHTDFFAELSNRLSRSLLFAYLLLSLNFTYVQSWKDKSMPLCTASS